MGINIKFTDDDWDRIEKDWSAWWEGEIDRPMVMIESVNTLMGPKSELT